VKANRLSEKASKINKEAKELLKSLDKVESELEKKNFIPVRKATIKQVESIFQKVMEEVQRENAVIMKYPRFESNREVWVYAFYDAESKQYIISAIRLDRKSFAYVVLERLKKGVIHHTVEIFKQLIQQLTTFIQEGKHDHDLHLSGEELIHNIMLHYFDKRKRNAEKQVDQILAKKAQQDKPISKYQAKPKYVRTK